MAADALANGTAAQAVPLIAAVAAAEMSEKEQLSSQDVHALLAALGDLGQPKPTGLEGPDDEPGSGLCRIG